MADKSRVSKPAVLAAFATMLVMPFYVGFVHWTVGQFCLYALVASLAMATGEYLETPATERLQGWLFFQETLLWMAAVMFAGGIAYLLAWLF